MLFDFDLEFVIIKLEKLRGKDMTKIAVLSDIHGNTTALEAVLADAQKRLMSIGSWEISSCLEQDEKIFSRA